MSVAEKMTAIADAIREKTGDTAKLSLDGMAEAIRKLPGPIVATASGSPISLTDATDLKMRGLKLFGKTTQDGTPSPEAPVPLVSAGDGGSLGVTVAGKNLLDLLSPIQRQNNIMPESYITEEKANSVQLTGSASGSWVFIGYTYKLPPGTYTLSAKVETDGDSNMVWFGTRKTISGSTVKQDSFRNGGSVKFTITEEIPYVNVRFHLTTETGTNGETWNTRYYDIQIEKSDTVTAYEPYKEAQTLPVSTPNGLPGIPVTSGGNYTDETGQQWVCDEVDFGRGVYVQRVKEIVFDGSDDENWIIQGQVSPAGIYRIWNQQYRTVIKKAASNSSKGNAVCSNFVIDTANNTWGKAVNAFAIDQNADIWFIRPEFTSTATLMADWRNYLAEKPITMIAELATPIETPLPAEELAAYAALHTNYPNTTILNDGGAGMEVNYVADTKLYIDNKINAMAAAIVNA